MRQAHRAGEKAFVDFSGDGIPIVNRKTGEVTEAALFVAALGVRWFTASCRACSQVHLAVALGHGTPRIHRRGAIGPPGSGSAPHSGHCHKAKPILHSPPLSILIIGGPKVEVHEVLALVGGYVDQELLLRNEYLAAENEILRSKLRGRLRLTNPERMRLARLGKRLGRKALREIGTIVRPETVLRWYRDLIAKKFDGSRHRKYPGKSRVDEEVERLVILFAEENPGWGFVRIQGALKNLGIKISHQTVGNILKRNGIPPAPQRGRGWAAFIEKHKHLISAADFFTVEVLEPVGLQTYYVLAVIQLASRKVRAAGITAHPNAAWMRRKAQELTQPDSGFLQGQQFLIHDRDSKFCEGFRKILRSAGVAPLRLPPRSPNLNAFAERWIGSVKRECLSEFIVVGRQALRGILDDYVDHYHQERNHQGVGNRLLFGEDYLPTDGLVACRKRLGGLLRFYYREAA
jgi:transposase InsO family protein